MQGSRARTEDCNRNREGKTGGEGGDDDDADGHIDDDDDDD